MTARRPDIAEPEPAWTSYGQSDPAATDLPTERMTVERATERVNGILKAAEKPATAKPTAVKTTAAKTGAKTGSKPTAKSAEPKTAEPDSGVDHASDLEITEQALIGQQTTVLVPAVAEPVIAEQRGSKSLTRQANESGDTSEQQPSDNAKLVRLHESIAALLAARGEYRQAYQHMRSALDLVYVGQPEQLPIPEQFRREVDRLRREHAEAREQSIRDSLTASYNRRYLDQRLTAMLAADTGPSKGGLAVALVDLDWFKQVNDRYGHLLGDRVLQRVVELLTDGLPEPAFCARYGGEEFVLVLPDIDMTSAIAVAEAARTRVERHHWPSLAPGLQVTVSVGLAFEPPSTPALRQPTSAEQHLLHADSLLYAAKQSGRNAVAYRHAGRVLLAGSAAGRRWVAEPRAAG